MIPTRWKAVLALAAAMAVAGGCTNPSPSEEREVFARRSSGEVTIAVAWPFAARNDLFDEGVSLAVSEINAGGGAAGRMLTLLKQDDEASVTRGLEIAEALSGRPEIAAVIGHRNSYVSIPTASVYERNGLLMLSPASTAPALTQDGHRRVFRNISSDAHIAGKLADYAYRQGHRKMVVLYDDDDYGRGLASAFEAHAAVSGIEVVDRLSRFAGPLHLDELRFKWEQLAYDGVFIAKSNPGGTELIAALRRAGVEVPLFAGNAMDSADLWRIAGDRAAEGIVIGSFFHPHSDRPEVRGFIARFQAEYGTAPTQYSALGYDAVHLLAEAIDRAGAPVPEAMAEALRGLRGWEGVIGTHEFAQNGDDVGDLVVLKRVTGGSFEYLDAR